MTTREILMRDGWRCQYCGKRAVHADHVLAKSTRQRLAQVANIPGRRFEVPAWALELVAACFDCNMRKAARLLIPPSWADRLDELNGYGIGVFRVWRGDMATLQTTAKQGG